MAVTEENTARDRRRSILERTTDLFLEKGFYGTSMSDIAKANCLTKASLYHHFPGKDDLFAACVTYGYTAALDAIRAIADDAARPPADKLRTGLRAIYQSIIRSPVGRMSPLIAEVSRTHPNVARSFHKDYIVPQQALFGRIIDEGIATGDFADVDRRQLYHIVFGPVVTLSLSREMFASFDDLDDHFPVDELMAGHTEIVLRMLSPNGK